MLTLIAALVKAKESRSATVNSFVRVDVLDLREAISSRTRVW